MKKEIFKKCRIIPLESCLFFDRLPKHYEYSDELVSNGYYGSALKGGIERPILHSSIFKLINECEHIDFIFVPK